MCAGLNQAGTISRYCNLDCPRSSKTEASTMIQQSRIMSDTRSVPAKQMISTSYITWHVKTFLPFNDEEMDIKSQSAPARNNSNRLHATNFKQFCSEQSLDINNLEARKHRPVSQPIGRLAEACITPVRNTTLQASIYSYAATCSRDTLGLFWQLASKTPLVRFDIEYLKSIC